MLTVNPRLISLTYPLLLLFLSINNNNSPNDNNNNNRNYYKLIITDAIVTTGIDPTYRCKNNPLIPTIQL